MRTLLGLAVVFAVSGCLGGHVALSVTHYDHSARWGTGSNTLSCDPRPGHWFTVVVANPSKAAVGIPLVRWEAVWPTHTVGALFKDGPDAADPKASTTASVTFCGATPGEANPTSLRLYDRDPSQEGARVVASVRVPGES